MGKRRWEARAMTSWMEMLGFTMCRKMRQRLSAAVMRRIPCAVFPFPKASIVHVTLHRWAHR